MKLSAIGEFGLIDLLAKSAVVTKDVIKGIGDDAAVLRTKAGELLLLTTDMLIEGGHFKRSLNPELIGRKALACSISDVAAMGGVPTFAVVSLGVPVNLDVAYVKKIYAGLNRLARQFGVSLVGGDTVKSNKIVINVALAGKIRPQDLVLRSGAKNGDTILVSGPLGGSLKSGRHLSFVPRVKEAQFLVQNFKPTAMMDISDGLVSDLRHILKQSKVGAVLHERLIPRSQGCNLQSALSDGEDFELLFTLNPQQYVRMQNAKRVPFRFFTIGEISGKKEELILIDRDSNRRVLNIKGFQHF